MTRALVTGSTGFIGSHLVEKLLAKDIKVRCLLRWTKSDEKYLEGLDVERHYIDGYDDTSELELACKDVNYVYHLAARTKGANLEQFYDSNVVPANAMLDVISNSKISLKRFVLLSTLAASQPIEHYGWSKQVAEDVVKFYGDQVPYTIVRTGGVYGPKDKDYFRIFNMINKGLKLYDGSENKKHMIIHVDDLVGGVIDAGMNLVTDNNTYDLCNDDPVSLNILYDKIEEVMGKKARGIKVPRFLVLLGAVYGSYLSLRGRDVILNLQKRKLASNNWVIDGQDTSVAKNDFGFKTDISLEDGLRDTYSWYLNNDWIKR